MNKFSKEFVTEQFLKHGYKILDNDYISNGTKMKLIDKDGYIVYGSYANLITENKNPTRFGFQNKSWMHNVRIFVNKMNGNSKILKIKKITKNNKNRILVTGKCGCGKIFNWIFCSELSKTDKFMCPKCKKKITAGKRRTSLKNCKKIFYNHGYNIVEFKNKDVSFNNTDKILVEDSDGYRGYMDISHLKRNQHFSIFSNKFNDSFLIYNANKCMKNNGFNLKINSYDNSKYYKGAFNCTCSCGRTFSAPIYQVLSGKRIQCEECSKSISSYEKIIKEFFDNNNIKYIYQYVINECRDMFPLPFDFYVNNKLIEIDGEGHYRPCNFNQISNEDAMKSFNFTKKHDKIKNDYCKNHNIKLLRISYEDIKNDTYKNKILSFIRE
jgi:hypothetical protein